MKNLLRPLEITPPTKADISDGIITFATNHLSAIKYPNRITDIAVLGRLRDWHRSFLLRPKYGGRFIFLMYPKNNLAQETIIIKKFHLQAFNSSPILINITVPHHLRFFDIWEWRVIKTDGANEDENSFDELDSIAISDGMLTGRSSSELAMQAMEKNSLITLIFQIRAIISGEVVFEEERSSGEAKIAAWSCHQPYASEKGKAIVKPENKKILNWYRKRIEDFSPHMVWMLGDSVYSDGTGALDFVKQVYDQKGWQDNWAMRKDLLSLYRLNYRYHWSFEPLQAVMRRFPHLGMWDDHEIRDGYGSDEKDFKACNIAIKQIASQAAEEFLFQYSPKLRSESTRNSAVDNHQAYVNKTIAAFIFDGRNSRNYGEDMPVPSEVSILASTLAGLLLGAFTGGVPGGVAGALGGAAIGTKLSAEIIDVYRWHNPGEVISDLQLKDFERFCHHVKSQYIVKYIILGNCVPFIYILDFVESIAAESAILATETGKAMRDDIRDSWHSPANRRQLAKLIDILRDLHHARNDLEFINISGDIHISNAFCFQPDGFNKPLYQVTSSALTNDPPSEEGLLNLLSEDGPLSINAKSDIFGHIERLWHVGDTQNFLAINATLNEIELHLHIYHSSAVSSKVNDKILTIRPNQGYTLS